MAQTARRPSSVASFDRLNATTNNDTDISQSFQDWRSRLNLPIHAPSVSVRDRVYANYAANQQAHASKQAVAYWTNLLKDQTPASFQHSPPLPKTADGTLGEHRFGLDDAQLFHKSCASAGTGAPTLIQAAWALTLKAYLATDDICFAYKPPSRDVPLVGSYMKSLYRRVNVNDKEPSKRFLRKIHATYLDGLSHHGCSAGDVQRAMDANIFCNSLLSIRFAAAGQKASSISMPEASSEHDITLSVNLSKDQVSFIMLYKPSCISPSTVSALGRSFSEALFGLTVSPMTLIGGIVVVPKPLPAEPVISVLDRPSAEDTDVVPPFSLCNLRPSELAHICGVPQERLEDAYPVTPLQEGLMTITQREPDAFMAREMFNLGEHVDASRLRHVIDAVAKEFPILRTRLVQVSSEHVLQVVVKDALHWEEASSLSEYQTKDRSVAMSYGSPLWRFALFNDASTNQTFFCWTAHHAGYDGWSEDHLLATIRSAYEKGSFVKPRPFVDFIRYSKEIDEDDTQAYWASQLSGEKPTPFPQLPAGVYRPHVDQRIMHRIPLVLPRHTTILTSSFLTAAWALTASTYSDSEDIIFASTSSGRQAPLDEVETIAGPTITTVPIRVSIDKTATVSQYLSKINDGALDMIPHEHYGLQNINRISADVRKAMVLRSYFLVQPTNPALENPHAIALGLNRVPGSGEDFSADAYPLNVQCHLDGDHVIINATFDDRVLSKPQMELMVQQFSHVIRTLGESSEAACLQDMELTPSSEQDAMIKLNGPLPATIAKCIHHIIDEQARDEPEAQAICSFDGNMTYAELCAEANKLAAHLIQLGVGPEVPVPICMDKGRLVIVTMLAVLKAGGTVVCFSASQPQKRLAALLEGLRTNFVLSAPQHTHIFDGLPCDVTAVTAALLDSLPNGPANFSAQSPVHPNNAAFICYTSGSTGMPKAIVTEHQAICTSSQAHGAAMRIDRGQRVLQFASFLYDVYIQDIFTTLQRGATICVVSEEERYNDLAGAINRSQATWADLTSTVADLLDPDSVPTLKTISLGGEPMKPEVCSKWEPRDGMEVINVYGPAECSVTSALSTIAQRKGQANNIGPPCGCWSWVVDSSNRNILKPIGTVGELLLEGPLLARHYLNDQEKTDAAFLHDLAWMKPLPGTSERRRVYATGDLVKLQTDGTILYVGRADKQVKINGQRVELGEIESQLSSSGADMKTACELISTSAMQGRKVLVAFIAGGNFKGLPTLDDSTVIRLSDELKEALAYIDKKARQALPSHMIPGLYIPVATLPKSPSGKLDRKALKTIMDGLSQEDARFYSISHSAVTPLETPRQFQLRDIWCSLLRLPSEAVGADSNFFAVGADSLSAMQLVPRAQAQGLGITVAQIFQHPVLRDMAADLDELKVEDSLNFDKFAICDSGTVPLLLEEAESQTGQNRDTFNDIYPSTRLQEGLLALTAVDPDAYVNRMVFKLPSGMDVARFKAAFEKVYEAHPILRTRLFLSSAAERYMQVVMNDSLVWRTGADVAEYIEKDEAEHFDAGTALAKFALIYQQDEHYLVWTLHHAVYDGWSIKLLFEDLQNAYKDLPMSNFGDFRPFVSFLESQNLPEQEHYWKSALAEEGSVSWPTGSTSTAAKPSQATVRRRIPTTDVQRAGLRPALLFRAAWALTTAQYAASDDIIMAVTMSGRDMPVANALDLTAPLLTTVPLRVKFNRSQTVGEFLNQIQAQAAEMIRFQHFGLQNVVNEQKKQGMPLRLNQLFLVQPGDPSGEVTGGGLGLEQLEAASGNFETYPLNVEVVLGEHEALIEVVHDTSVLDSTTMNRVMDQYSHMLRLLSGADGASTLGSLDVVNKTDRNWIDVMNSNIPKGLCECVHDRVQSQVRRRPDAQAISSFDRDWTYAELDEAAESLANKLRLLGVGPGSSVPLCFEKSSFAIVAMYATLKAGGACASISPTYPRDRVALIVEDTKATVALCSPQHVSVFDGIHAAESSLTALGVDEDLLRSCIDVAPTEQRDATHADPAFLVYTSGSTGRPKGVVVEHGASTSSAAAHGPAFGFCETTRTVQFAAYTFDVSIQDIFTTLQSGGAVCVISEEERMSDLAAAINKRNANWMEMTPTVAALLSPAEVPSIKIVSLGGEQLTEQALSKWYKDGVWLLNTYGPTECAIDSTFAVIDSTKFNVANIGKPVGCVLWVTAADDHHQLLPVGCVGEMLIEGPILAREYLNDPVKTGAAFVSGMRWLPSNSASQARRFYKTGDLVRYREDGGVDYLGRKDQQVKINGLRIELGEIESQAENSSDNVKAVAVDVIQPKVRAGSKILAAFVKMTSSPVMPSAKILALDSGLQAEFEAVKAHLETAVPTYMVPSLYIPMSDLPMSVSGKLDRKVLKALGEALGEKDLVTYGLASEEDAAADAPASSPEQLGLSSDAATTQIIEIASKILKKPTEKVNLNLSFISAGGDSISAMMFTSQCRAAGLAVTVGTLLKSKSLVEVVKSVSQQATTTSNVLHDIVGRTFGLSPVQRMYFEELSSGANEGDHHYNQSWYGKLNRPVEANKVLDAAEALIAAHPMLRSRFVQNGLEWQQTVLPAAKEACLVNSFAVEDLSQLCDIINERQTTSLDPKTGPVFALDAFQLPDGTQYICMIAHHLVVDIVSWDVIVEDLRSFIEDGKTIERELMPFPVWAEMQIEKGRSSALSPKNTGADFETSTDRAFWGMDESTRLSYQSSKSQNISIDADTTSKLLGPANKALSTEVIDLLLAAVAQAFLVAFPDRNRLTIFNEGHGREPWSSDVDLTRTVGWFTTIFPVSVSRDAGDDLLSLVRQVKDNRKALDSNGWASYTSRYLNQEGIERSKNQDSLMEVEMNWHGQPRGDEEGAALFEDVDLDVVRDQGADVPAQTLFDIGALVTLEGKLDILFEYQTGIERQDGIQMWIQEIENSLCGIADALPVASPQWTLSDVPLLKTSYAGLDKLQSSILPGLGKIAKDNVEDVYPCTPMQDGILLAQLRDPEAYKTEHTFEVRCADLQHPLSASQFAAAWQSLVARHTAFRSIFVEAVGDVAAYEQIVLKSFKAEVVFCESDSVENALAEIHKTPTVDYTEPVPPHRLTICTIPGGSLMCRIEASHTITDGFSGDVLENDLNEAYWAGSLSPLGSVYRDFVESVYSISTADKLAYWKTHLEGLEPTQFPHLARESRASTATSNIFATLSNELSTTAKDFCERQGITVATLIQAAWAAVLNLYTGSETVCFGYLASGRDASVADIEKSIGAFMNMLVCRVDFKKDSTSHGLVKQVYNDALQSLAHQHVSLADVQHELGLSGQSLFNTIMSFQKSGSSAADDKTPRKELTFEEVAAEDPTEYDIAIDVGVDDESIELSLDYSQSCLTKAQAGRVLASFEQAVVNLTAADPIPLCKTSPMSPEDLSSLSEWNGPLPERLNQLVHGNVALQAQRQPDSPAIVSFNVSLTYAELDSLSDKLAAHLQSAGVSSGSKVPLCFQKTTWAAVAQLAVFKAGAACVSLNPEHPQQRLAAIVADCEASVILSSGQCSGLVQQLGQTVITVDDGLFKTLPDATPQDVGTKPSDTAFIVFTSGSTGTPKGVVLSHSALAMSALSTGSAMGIDAGTRVLQYAAYTYDVSIQDLWTTLQRGGTTVIVSEEERLNIDKLVDAINSRQANWADLTPTVAGLITPDRVPSLATVSLGGEAVPQDVLDMWEEAGRRVINGYGPAEAAVNSACSTAEQRAGDSSNIGKPLGGWLWVTRPNDPDYLAPVGTVGELLIEGPQLADGYLHDEKKTASAFISDPAWIDSVSSNAAPSVRRMYRTGDMVRMTEQGTYVFVGRGDRQVKIRGQRVELGDIEAQVKRAAPSEVAVAVDVVKNIGGRERPSVVAFFDLSTATLTSTSKDDGLLLPCDAMVDEELCKTRDAVVAALPNHMVPSYFVPLKQFPVNPSGKMDLKSLHSLMNDLESADVQRVTLSTVERRAPGTDIEKKLHALFCQVLSLDTGEFGLDDSFVALGGDSIMAMRLVKEARKAGLQLSVPDVLRHPKLVDLAGHLSQSETSVVEEVEQTYEPFSLLDTGNVNKTSFIKEHILPKCPLARDGNLLDVHPVTDVQTTFARSNVKSDRDWVVHFTWTGDSTLNIAKLRESLKAMVVKFDSLRSAFIEHDDRILQVVLKKMPHLDVQLYFTEKKLKDAMDELQDCEMGRPIRYGEPVAQSAIIQHAGEGDEGMQMTVVLRMTHAQYDGASMGVMVDYFTQHYNGKPTIADEQPQLSHGNYVQHVSAADKNAAAVDYWRDLLSGAPNTNVCALDPYPNERGTDDTEMTAQRTLPLSQLQSSTVTFAAMLKASWARVLSDASNSPDVVFADMVTGRATWPHASRVDGCCFSVVPLRLTLEPNTSISTLARTLADQTRASTPHETLGWDTIVRNCTSWPVGSSYGSLVQHSNLEAEEPVRLGKGGKPLQHGVYDRGGTGYENVALETEMGDGRVEVILNWTSRRMSVRFAEELIDSVCRVLAEGYAAQA